MPADITRWPRKSNSRTPKMHFCLLITRPKHLSTSNSCCKCRACWDGEFSVGTLDEVDFAKNAVACQTCQKVVEVRDRIDVSDCGLI